MRVADLPPAKRGVRYALVAGFPGYAVGTDGSVWSRRVRGGGIGPWRQLRPRRIGRTRHCYVYLYDGSGLRGRRHVTIHTLVLEAFVGPCPPGMVGRHYPDRDPANNALANLSWGTPSQNVQDSLEHGTHHSGMVHGERHGQAKLTDAQAREIHALVQKTTVSEVARRFGVSVSVVHHIATGKRWKHLGLEPLPGFRHNLAHRGEQNPSAKLTASQVAEIRARYQAGGITQAELARKYGVTQVLVSRIVLGKVWAHLER